MIEIESAGPWPFHTIEDVNNARSKVMCDVQIISEVMPEMVRKDAVIQQFIIVAPTEIIRAINRYMANTEVSYFDFMKKFMSVPCTMDACDKGNDVILYSIYFDTSEFPAVKPITNMVHIKGVTLD